MRRGPLVPGTAATPKENGMRQWIRWTAQLVCAVAMVPPASAAEAPAPDDLRQQVMAAERAFAKTMADRDHHAFAQFVSQEAVFFSGPQPLRGRQQVVDWWARYYQGAQAPFAWEPEEVEVLASGTLALSSGPVRDPAGQLIGRFTSIWRLEAPGQWRVVFDKGSPACKCPAP
jgi:ketosteroid isomerase-like protein